MDYKDKTIEITEDCYCEHYLHEKTKYPRPGLVEKRFFKGERYTVLERWNNFYGVYYRVEVNGKLHDIDVDNAKVID